jgi:fumarylacetoacetase
MPRIESWIPVPPGSDFSIYNLPYGAFRPKDAPRSRLGIAIGDQILDLAAVADAGLLTGICPPELLKAPVLNPFLAAGRDTWKRLRLRIASLLRTDSARDDSLRNMKADAFFHKQRDVRMTLPVQIGDYVDFYSSIEHATNLGKLFRPDGEPLLPNYRHIPIGYHGRSSTVVIDGTRIVRPRGQTKSPNMDVPVFGPTRKLDIELEVGFITGPANKLGQPIPIDEARDHIFGLVLVNDWSARDIQAWEYQPLGPFLGKSFATTISPWVVTLDALDPFRVKGPRQEPQPLPYLETEERWAFDLRLAVDLSTERMRERGQRPVTIAQTNFKDMYWNMAQQLAHVTANGTMIRPGDLYASGTISGKDQGTQGSLIELSWNGERPIKLEGETRTFLEDGDEITLRGWSEANEMRVGFGQARGRIVSS